MGLTLIQRSSGLRPPKNPKIALVLAGGAVSGGAFKVGGLKALDEFLVGRKVNELDTYIGLSAGAFLATSLAAGITPDEMIEEVEATLLGDGTVRNNDVIVIISGAPMWVTGTTNLLKLHRVGDRR